jgi:hypothetical protein
VAQVCSHLEQSGGGPAALTQFYINMTNLEATASRATKGTKRYHRAGGRIN